MIKLLPELQTKADIIRHLLKVQQVKCATPINECQYDNGRGNHCSIGHCLSKEDCGALVKEWGNAPVDSLYDNDVIDVSPEIGIDFLVDLQSVHDGTPHNNGIEFKFKPAYDARLRQLAKHYGVEI